MFLFLQDDFNIRYIPAAAFSSVKTPQSWSAHTQDRFSLATSDLISGS